MKKLAAILCGAAPGMTVEQLISIYGQPVSRNGDDLIFSDFRVEIDDNRPNVVESIETRSGAIATPDGVKIGQDAGILNRVYGQADKVDAEWNETDYEYFSDNYSQKIEFTVKNGVIVKIKCRLWD